MRDNTVVGAVLGVLYKLLLLLCIDIGYRACGG